MKCVIPEISYHNRDPVLSLDFQQGGKEGDPLRLATAGSDSHVVIFAVTESTEEEGKVELDCLCDLTRHQKAVNIVRWSPDGNLLASGDDESVIILWTLKPGSDAPAMFDEDSEENKENWVVYKMLRFHLDDVYDLSWSPCSQFILSGSVDNTAIISNVHKNQKAGHLSDSQGFVQGVAWNPKHNVFTAISSDRKCRSYNALTHKQIGATYKAFLNLEMDKITKQKKKSKQSESSTEKMDTDSKMMDTESKSDTSEQRSEINGESNEGEKEESSNTDEQKKTECEDGQSDVDPVKDIAADQVSTETAADKAPKSVRLFHDDTFKGFFRRLHWSNDGELLVVPSGVVETDTEAKLTHCTYVFTRIDLNKPALCLPSRDKYTIAVRFCPLYFKLRPIKRKDAVNSESQHPWEQYETLFALPYRMVYAVATQNAVMVYDTQQAAPIARVSNIHYTGLTDLSWSPDGRILIVSSSDGFCSIISFHLNELGEEYIPESATETPVDTPAATPLATPDFKQKLAIKELEGDEKEEKNKETNSQQENSDKAEEEGFDEHGVKSPAQIHIKSRKEGGKSNPKRLKFITLSSPKAKDKRRGAAGTVDTPTTDPPLAAEEEARDGTEDAMDGISSLPGEGEDEMQVDSGDLRLVLEESQQTVPEVPEKKRVPLVTLSSTATANVAAPAPTIAAEGKGRRVELITLSSPKPKAKH